MYSMMSISPEAAQPPYVSSLKNIQKAGHIPWPTGSLIRATNRPYVQSPFERVFMRVEV